MVWVGHQEAPGEVDLEPQEGCPVDPGAMAAAAWVVCRARVAGEVVVRPGQPVGLA